MIFLVFTRAGLDELKANFGRVPSPLWINEGVLSDAEIAQLQRSGAPVRKLAGYINPQQPAAVEHAIRFVQEQHAGGRVWAERTSPRVKTPDAGSTGPVQRVGKTGQTHNTRDWRRILQGAVGRADDLFDRALRLPRTRPNRAPFMIVPYLGYGTAEKLLLNGRVLRDEGLPATGEAGTSWQNLMELYKRLASREVPGARVRARFRETEQEAVADREGYFSIEIALAQPLEAPGWHPVELELLHPAGPRGKTLQAAQVLVPPATARFGIISDIDDTVVWTNVTNKLKMLLMLARSNAYTRKPFKGVAAFYRALHNGAGGNEGNPIFYVSSSPWNLYSPLVEYMRVQGIPRGPLFLKDFGDHTLFSSRDHHSHKLAGIEQILHAFPHLKFILIGDSGEQDPEIYSRVVKMYPERVSVIYIRNVNPDPARIAAIDKLIEQVGHSGARLVLAPDSEYAAVHAAAHGLISADDVVSVRMDKREDEAGPNPRKAGDEGA